MSEMNKNYRFILSGVCQGRVIITLSDLDLSEKMDSSGLIIVNQNEVPGIDYIFLDSESARSFVDKLNKSIDDVDKIEQRIKLNDR